MKKLWIFLEAACLVFASVTIASAAEYTIQDGEITVTDVPENAHLLIASYDESGIFRECKMYEDVSPEHTITAEYSANGADGTTTKCFLWEKGTMRPFPLTEKKADLPKKTLVAYFSWTNHTEDIAKHIVRITGADAYEIIPQIPYGPENNNYYDHSTRAYQEQYDSAARPAISGSVENMEQYGTVFVGYPIWYGKAPKIIYTFLQSYDFSGKTIIPFCTSSSSGIGSTAELQDLTPGASWLAGKRFNIGESETAVREWIRGLNLD